MQKFNPNDVSEVTLLSVEEAKTLPEEIVDCGEWWWLRSPGHRDECAANVLDGGFVDEGGWYTVFNGDGAVRPAFRIPSLKSSNLKIGDIIKVAGTEAFVISDTMALTIVPIGHAVFRDDWEPDDANDYEASDVKKWLEDWWQEQIDKNEQNILSETTRSVTINNEHKDRLFRMLFGSKDMRKNIISLYNALNGTDYPDDAEFEITTLEDVIYISMKNDVSLLLDSNMTLWEQQSTYSPNMPLRGLMYFSNLYNAYIEKNDLNIYGSALVRIPTPKYVVFYNGLRNTEPICRFKLSDAFINADKENEFEWTATMYNLNKGKNDELLSKCKALSDYMTFIKYIREYQASGMEIRKAIDESVTRCIDEGVLEEFLRKQKSEVMNVCLTEFNEKAFVNGIHNEGYTEGRIEGRIESIRLLLKAGKTPLELLAMGFDSKEIDKAANTL